jgi:hypothetical protein
MTCPYFWLSDDQFARLAPHLPTDTRGVPRVDDRRVITGIVHVLEVRRPLGRCALGLWPAEDPLQPVRALGGQGRVERYLRCPGFGGRPADRGAD